LNLAVPASGGGTRSQGISYSPGDNLVGDNPPSNNIINGFSSSTEWDENKDLILVWKLPPDYVSSTDISIFLQWSAENSTVGNVEWEVRFSSRENGEIISSSPDTTLNVVTITPGVTEEIITSTIVIDGTAESLTKDHYLNIQVERVSNTYSDKVLVTNLSTEYTSQL